MMTDDPLQRVEMLIDSGADLIEEGIKATEEAAFQLAVARGLGEVLREELEATNAEMRLSPAGKVELDRKTIYEHDITAILKIVNQFGLLDSEYVDVVHVPERVIEAHMDYKPKTTNLNNLIKKLGDQGAALEEAMGRKEPIKGVKFERKVR